MPLTAVRLLEIAVGAAVVAGVGAVGAWVFFRKRPTPRELEVLRRTLLTQSGRLVDGNLLDVHEVPAEDGRTLTMLLYSYRIGGVDYECSQDITDIPDAIDVPSIRAGFPCSVRYQPGNPQNSIVIAEKWSGLRVSVPLMPLYDGRHSFGDRFSS